MLGAAGLVGRLVGGFFRRLRLIDVIVNRVLVYAALVAIIGAVYFGLIALGFVEGFVAALAAGALFHPVRLRLQALADRLFKVESDPYRLADRVSQSVQAASGPAEALASGAVAIRQALRADGVTVEMDGAPPVTDGTVGQFALVTPLVWHGRPVGRLLVAGRRLDPSLLDMLARHLAEVAHAVQLTEDLRRSRARLLATREEERGRLLQVLDDGLGSTLVSLAGEIDGSQRDPRVLQRVREELTEAITNVRDLVYGLYPPALERDLDPPRRPPEPVPVMEEEPGARVKPLVALIVWTGAVLAPIAAGFSLWLTLHANLRTETTTVDPIGLLFPIAGAFVIVRRPRLLIPWLMWGAGVAWSAYLLAFTGSHWMFENAPDHPILPYTAWLALWVWLLTVPTISGIMPLLFPDGRLPSKRWRPVLWINIVLIVGHALLLGLSPDASFEIGFPYDNPFGVEALGRFPQTVEDEYIGPVIIGLAALGVVSLGFRYRAASTETRRQIAWYVAIMAILVAIWLIKIAVPASLAPTMDAVFIMSFGGAPIAIVASVLRHQLYGIRVILNRALVYGSLAAVLALGYSGLIWVGDALAGGFGPLAGLVAALCVGAVFHPVRLRLQRSVDRLFGVERDPYRAADRLSRSVQEAGDPAEALATATSVLRWAIGAKGAGVEVDGELFVDGELGHRPTSVELAWHGEPVGRLLIAGTRREPPAVMAKHLAELAHAVRLAADLRRSRERIRAAREEERRRLGRELHDGLGPALTSVTMTLDAARRSLERDPGVAALLLTQVSEGMNATIVSVRDLVDGLRPPSLDDLGLAGSLKVFAQAPGPAVEVTEESLGELPPQVELAAYRIVQEALTNVRRHARATSARIQLTRTEHELLVTVSDDGIGLPRAPDPGVGLTSMRERATEVGGDCEVRRRAGGGTEVAARLPL